MGRLFQSARPSEWRSSARDETVVKRCNAHKGNDDGNIIVRDGGLQMPAACQSEYDSDGGKYDHGGRRRIEGPASVVILVGFLVRDVGWSDLKDHVVGCASEELVEKDTCVGCLIYIRNRVEWANSSARRRHLDESMGLGRGLY